MFAALCVTTGDAACLQMCASVCFYPHEAYSTGVHVCHSFGDVSRCSLLLNIKVNMERVCISLIALTSVFSREEGEFKSLMASLHLFKVFFEKLPHGGVD